MTHSFLYIHGKHISLNISYGVESTQGLVALVQDFQFRADSKPTGGHQQSGASALPGVAVPGMESTTGMS